MSAADSIKIVQKSGNTPKAIDVPQHKARLQFSERSAFDGKAAKNAAVTGENNAAAHSSATFLSLSNVDDTQQQEGQVAVEALSPADKERLASASGNVVQTAALSVNAAVPTIGTSSNNTIATAIASDKVSPEYQQSLQNSGPVNANTFAAPSRVCSSGTFCTHCPPGPAGRNPSLPKRSIR